MLIIKIKLIIYLRYLQKKKNKVSKLNKKAI